KTDLEHMVFDVASIELSNSNIKFIQSPVPETFDEEPSQPPFLSVENIKLSNVYANYQSHSDRISAVFDIQQLDTKIPKINLAESDFEISNFDLKNSKITLNTQTETNVVTHKVEEVAEEVEQDIKAFEWPELRFSVGSINLENNNFSYFVASAEAKKGNFNPNAVILTNINLQAGNIALKDKTANFHIENSSFKEISGLDLKALSLSFHANDNTLKVENLITSLNNNRSEERRVE